MPILRKHLAHPNTAIQEAIREIVRRIESN